MTLGVWILGDQLHPHHPALTPPPTPILMVESHHWVEQRNYHQQKLVLVWSAMRHRAAELQQQGYRVTYQEAPNFRDPLLEWIGQEGITHVHLMTPADIPFRQHLQALWPGIPAELVWVENNQFLWSADEFSHWARGRKRLLMEDFYRLGRKKYQILMDGDRPLGGRWNFDADNRKTPPPGAPLSPPPPPPPPAPPPPRAPARPPPPRGSPPHTARLA
ncbi:MAG: cryptochrome/photolyase family protein, partial [Thermostichales cyanobacterium DRC_bins_46]